VEMKSIAGQCLYEYFISTASICWSALLLLSNQLLGTESFLRSYELVGYSRNSPHFMEPQGSLPHSQEPAICPCPEPDQSCPCPPPNIPTSFTSTSKSLDFHPLSRGWQSRLKFVHFRFTAEVLTAMSIKNIVFLDVMPCQLLERCQTFRITCYLRLHCRTVPILKNEDSRFIQGP
jgi:hypothetical protein